MRECTVLDLSFASHQYSHKALVAQRERKIVFAVFVMHCSVFRFLLGVYHVFVYIYIYICKLKDSLKQSLFWNLTKTCLLSKTR